MEQGRWVGRGGWEEVGVRGRERENQNKSLLWRGQGGVCCMLSIQLAQLGERRKIERSVGDQRVVEKTMCASVWERAPLTTNPPELVFKNISAAFFFNLQYFQHPLITAPSKSLRVIKIEIVIIVGTCISIPRGWPITAFPFSWVGKSCSQA